jgi:hypothetical protein
MTDRSGKGRGLRNSLIRLALLCGLLLLAASGNAVGLGPIPGGALPGPLPLFPADNWWNVDISAAPSTPTRSVSSTSSARPAACIRTSAARCLRKRGDLRNTLRGRRWDPAQGAGDFVLYPGESDGVGLPFYPIPTQAIAQPHWIEGGDPGNVDVRDDQDRHLLIVGPRQQVPLRALQRLLQHDDGRGSRQRARSST